MKIKVIFAATFLVSLCICALAQNSVSIKEASQSEINKLNFMPLSEVRAGMRGTAKTVFEGTEATPFNIEILGVMPNGIGPKQDLIVCKISGGKAERTKVFAGMSGSPVEIDGKLVGAVAFSFPFSKEAICGITPIEQMISIFADGGRNEAKSSSPRSYSFGQLAATEWNPDYQKMITSGTVLAGAGNSAALNSLVGQSFTRISTPLSLSGFSPQTIKEFAPQLSGLGMMPVMGTSGNRNIGPLKEADETTLVGGDSVSVELVRGDLAASASGTVTLRDGNKVYAFGHPFLSLGSSSLPMSESSVVVVVPSINNSFKLAVTESMVGTMTQDRGTGIFGNLGEAPKMIPVKLSLVTSRKSKTEYNFEVAHDELLTPLLLNMALSNALSSQERNIGNTFVSMKSTMMLKDNPDVEISGRYSGQLAGRLATNNVLMTAFNLVTSNFDDLKIQGINVEMESSDANSIAILESIEVDKTKAAPGETVSVTAFVRDNRGRFLSQKIPFTIPDDAPLGQLRLVVGDGIQLQAQSAKERFMPNTLADLVSKINSVKKNDRLYLVAKRVTSGAVIGSSELPSLPPSVVATLGTSRRSNTFNPTVESTIAEVKVPKAEFVVVGLQQLNIEVTRK